MWLAKRLDRAQRRRRWFGIPVAVVFKYADDHGPYLAALITYYGFLALFPLLLLLTSVLGFVLQNEPELTERILDTAISQFPVLGSQLGTSTGLQGSGLAVVVGAVIALWGAIRACQATLHMMDVCWAVPRSERPDPLRSPLRSLPLLAFAALMLVGTTLASVLAGNAEAYGLQLRTVTQVLTTVLGFLVGVAVFLLAMRLTPSYPVGWRQALPGALVAGLGWQLLQWFGTAYFAQIARANDAYGIFGVVLGLVGFIYLTATIVVLSVELNVVLAKRLYPRALWAPFSDREPLTSADEKALGDVSRATRVKDYEEVDVTFEDQDGTSPQGNM